MYWTSIGFTSVRKALCGCRNIKTSILLQNSRSFSKCCSVQSHDGFNRERYSGRWNSICSKNILTSYVTARHFSASQTFLGGNTEPITSPLITPDFVEPVTSSTATVIDPTPVLDGLVSPDITEVVAGAIVDPPFVELGLATSWWPNHCVHQLLEFVHIHSDLPWWLTIFLGTICIRILTLPLYIYTRKYMIKYNNHKDEMQVLTDKVNKAKNDGNQLKQTMEAQKLRSFFKETGVGPLKGLLINVSMPIIFMSCIMAVRQMCRVPVPSMTEGGTLWFTNLAAADPYYILPILTGASMSMIIKVALMSGTLQTGVKYEKIIRKLQYVPVVLLPLVFGRYYSGIYIYWLANNFITFGIQRTMIIPGVREALKFPEPIPQKNANTGIRDAYKDLMKNTREKANAKFERKQIVTARKERERLRKKELRGAPPVTYTIGIDAVRKAEEIPDFEQEWRPPRPKQFGRF